LIIKKFFIFKEIDFYFFLKIKSGIMSTDNNTITNEEMLSYYKGKKGIKLILVLNENKISYEDLPELDLDNELYRIPIEKMTCPIMRFRHWRDGFGIAIGIVGKVDKKDTRLKKNPTILGLKAVASFFFGWRTKPDFGDQNYDSVKHALNTFHNNEGHIGSIISECPGCPTTPNNIHIQFASWLSGNDPFFALCDGVSECPFKRPPETYTSVLGFDDEYHNIPFINKKFEKICEDLDPQMKGLLDKTEGDFKELFENFSSWDYDQFSFLELCQDIAGSILDKEDNLEKLEKNPKPFFELVLKCLKIYNGKCLSSYVDEFENLLKKPFHTRKRRGGRQGGLISNYEPVM
jgi:hypothetical protein